MIGFSPCSYYRPRPIAASFAATATYCGECEGVCVSTTPLSGRFTPQNCGVKLYSIFIERIIYFSFTECNFVPSPILDAAIIHSIYSIYTSPILDSSALREIFPSAITSAQNCADLLHQHESVRAACIDRRQHRNEIGFFRTHGHSAEGSTLNANPFRPRRQPLLLCRWCAETARH